MKVVKQTVLLELIEAWESELREHSDVPAAESDARIVQASRDQLNECITTLENVVKIYTQNLNS